MKKYRIENIIGNFGIFLGDEIEATSYMDAIDCIMNEIMDNIGNYIDIELEEIEDEEETEYETI